MLLVLYVLVHCRHVAPLGTGAFDSFSSVCLATLSRSPLLTGGFGEYHRTVVVAALESNDHDQHASTLGYPPLRRLATPADKMRRADIAGHRTG